MCVCVPQKSLELNFQFKQCKCLVLTTTKYNYLSLIKEIFSYTFAFSKQFSLCYLPCDNFFFHISL